MKPLLRTAAAPSLLLGLTLAFTYPLGTRPATEALDIGPDTRLFLWTIAWDVHGLTTSPLSVFDANIFHDEPRTLAYSEHQIGSALLAAPLLLVSDNPLLAMNVVLVLSCFLSGAGAYYLARQLGLGRLASVATGIIFAFAPARFFRLAQLHLATVQWIPFCLALLHKYASRGSRRHLIGAAAFFTLQAWSSGHSGLFLAMAAAALVVYLFLMGELRPKGSLVKDGAWAAALTLALNVPFVVPYLQVRGDLGLERTLIEATEWSPNAESFLASPTHVHQWVLRSVGWQRHVERAAKAYLFPGLVPIALALFALARWRPAPRSARKVVGVLDALVLVLASVAILIEASGGFRIEVFGLRLSATGGGRTAVAALVLLGVRLVRFRREPFSFRRWRDALRSKLGVFPPFYGLLASFSLWAALGPPGVLYAALFRLVPGFDFIRVPSRLTLLTVLALAVLAGYGVERLGPKLRPFVLALLLVEFAAFPLDTVVYPLEVPAMDRWLAEQEGSEAIVGLPIPDPSETVASARRHSASMLYSRVHWRPLVNGYSGFTPQSHERLFRLLGRFPHEDGLQALENLGVRYAVFYRDGYRDREWEELKERLSAFGDGLRSRASFDEGWVYELTPNPRDRGSSEAR